MGGTAPLPQRGNNQRCFFGEAPVAADELEDAQVGRASQPTQDLHPRYAAPTGPGGLLPRGIARRASAGWVGGRHAAASARAAVPEDLNGLGAVEQEFNLGGVGHELDIAFATWGLNPAAEQPGDDWSDIRLAEDNAPRAVWVGTSWGGEAKLTGDERLAFCRLALRHRVALLPGHSAISMSRRIGDTNVFKAVVGRQLLPPRWANDLGHAALAAGHAGWHSALRVVGVERDRGGIAGPFDCGSRIGPGRHGGLTGGLTAPETGLLAV
jgi:hypothetical protein